MTKSLLVTIELTIDFPIEQVNSNFTKERLASIGVTVIRAEAGIISDAFMRTSVREDQSETTLELNCEQNAHSAGQLHHFLSVLSILYVFYSDSRK